MHIAVLGETDSLDALKEYIGNIRATLYVKNDTTLSRALQEFAEERELPLMSISADSYFDFLDVCFDEKVDRIFIFSVDSLEYILSYIDGRISMDNVEIV